MLQFIVKSSLPLLLAICIMSCDKDNSELTKAVLTGPDLRLCPCCGSLMINIDTDSTEMYGDDSFQIVSYPEGSFIDTDDFDYPIEVLVDFDYSDLLCGESVVIHSIQLRN